MHTAYGVQQSQRKEKEEKNQLEWHFRTREMTVNCTFSFGHSLQYKNLSHHNFNCDRYCFYICCRDIEFVFERGKKAACSHLSNEIHDQKCTLHPKWNISRCSSTFIPSVVFSIDIFVGKLCIFNRVWGFFSSLSFSC